MASTDKILCKCVERCGGPDGVGNMRSPSTVYKHRRADHDAAFARSTQARAAAEPSVPVPSISGNLSGQLRRLEEGEDIEMDLDRDMGADLQSQDEEV